MTAVNVLDRLTRNSFASRVALIFIGFSILWVFLSDVVVATIFGGPPVEWRIELIAGLIYALISGGLLYSIYAKRESDTEAARRASEERIKGLFESDLIGFCFWDSQGVVTDANETFLSILGFTRSELTARRLRWETITETSAEVWSRPKGEPVTSVPRNSYEVELTRKDGEKVWVVLGSTKLGKFDIGVGYLLDVTKPKRVADRQRILEDQLRQAQKLNAIGQLAGGVAHDFNNILSIVVGYATLLDKSLKEGDERRNSTQQILKASSKASSLISQLLTFSRQRALGPQRSNAHAVINDTGEMLARLIGDHIELSFNLEANQEKARVEPTQLEQILVNLAVNARDAMPNGGRVEIATSNVYLQEQDAKALGIEPGVYLRLVVSDNGTGMDEDTRSRLFEPFFTTKHNQGGVGLGLATVYGIVKQSGGHITVESQPNKGSVFTILLRCGEGEVDREKEALEPEKISERLASDITILLVEDDDGVRGVLKRVLELEGYRVLVAEDADAAISVALTHAVPIDLLVTDVRMPRVNGLQLAAKMRERLPNLQAILISGYFDDSAVSSGEVWADFEILQKPIIPAVLIRAVSRILSKRR
jgi:PAS domain S-box-containing protein